MFGSNGSRHGVDEKCVRRWRQVVYGRRTICRVCQRCAAGRWCAAVPAARRCTVAVLSWPHTYCRTVPADGEPSNGCRSVFDQGTRRRHYNQSHPD